MTQQNTRRVYFKLDAPDADEVTVSGTFNDWDGEPRRLKKNRKGAWSAYLQLEPGVHEYRFLVDGEWQNPPEAETMPNPFGTENCRLQVG